MESIFKTATAIGTPLALSGFICAALFLLFRQILAKKIFPSLGAALGAEVLKLVIKCLFVLALVGIVLAVASFLLIAYWGRSKAVDVSASAEPAVVATSPSEATEPSGSFEASNGDTFIRTGGRWEERSKGATTPSFTFTERSSDNDSLLLYDGSRDMYLRLPTHGGVSQWRLSSSAQWTDWLPVVRHE